MPDTNLTDEQRLAEFQNKLASFRPEGFDEEKFAALTKQVVSFHEDDIKGLKINSAKMKEEKDALSGKLTTLQASWRGANRRELCGPHDHDNGRDDAVFAFHEARFRPSPPDGNRLPVHASAPDCARSRLCNAPSGDA